MVNTTFYLFFPFGSYSESYSSPVHHRHNGEVGFSILFPDVPFFIPFHLLTHHLHRLQKLLFGEYPFLNESPSKGFVQVSLPTIP
jgi:hypothetical protein